MAFNKTGSFGVSASEKLDSLADWPRIVASREGGSAPSGPRMASKADPGEIVAQISDPDKWVFVHTTIMASVDLEDGSEHLIKQASEKWVNDNGDAWDRSSLLNDFGTFRNAAVYVEHNQHPEHAKGKVFDVVARQMDDTVLIDVLFGVDKRHEDLVSNITAGILNSVSMGCSTAFTKCSVCGNKALTENDYCEHVRDQKRQSVQAHGRLRKVAELCFENNFFDCSIVASPAFSGAVFRRLVASNDVLKEVFSNILCSRIEQNPQEFASDLRKAAGLISTLEKEHGETTVDSLRLEPGTGIFSASKGAGTIESVGEKTANVAWEDGTKESVGIGSIERTVSDRIFVTAAKPEVPDADRAGYHPIRNTETRKHEYQIDDRDFSDLPTTNNLGRTRSIDAHNDANPTTKLEGTEHDGFDGVTVRTAGLHRQHHCPSCRSIGLEFERRAASAEAGNGPDTLLCKDCGAVDMSGAYREAEASEMVASSADLILACRTAAAIKSPDARASFLASAAKSSAGASAKHVEAVLRETLRGFGIRVGTASQPGIVKATGATRALAAIAAEHGAVTTDDIVRLCGTGRASDDAAAHLAARGARVLPANIPAKDLRSLEERLEARLQNKWSSVRLMAICGGTVEHALSEDRVFKAWMDAQDNALSTRHIDFCDECLNALDAAGTCTMCGKDAKGDCHRCGEESVPLYQGQCAGCLDETVDEDAADAAEWDMDGNMVGAEPQADPAHRQIASVRTASFEKWQNLLAGLDVPEPTDARRIAAAELARLVDSRRVNVRIEASRKVSRILQAHPELTVDQAKSVLWRDLCEFMPAHDAGHVVSKVIDVKTNDQFGLGRNRPLPEAKEPVEEPRVHREMRASGSAPRRR